MYVRPRRSERRGKIAVITVAVTLVLAVVVTLAVAWADERRRDAEITDRLYCSLDGTRAYDVGPKTGRTCADIWLNQ